MTITTWANGINLVKQYVVKIRTPDASGTGFLISHSDKVHICGIATALHVVEHAHTWEEPIRIEHMSSGKHMVLRESDRAIIVLEEKDLAFILCPTGDIPVQPGWPRLIPQGKTIRQGVQIGWCGFPAVAPQDLCFFAGHVSCILKAQDSYLVDGVAINGVSGGPAFLPVDKDQFILGGMVSAYIPNRATGESLPGVCVVRSIGPYQEMLKEFKTIEQAQIEAAAKTVQKTDKETSNEATEATLELAPRARSSEPHAEVGLQKE